MSRPRRKFDDIIVIDYQEMVFRRMDSIGLGQDMEMGESWRKEAIQQTQA